MRKLLASLLALVMIVTLAACSGKKDGNISAGPETTAAPTDTPATDAPTTDAPVTDAPTTDTPITDAPATEPTNEPAPEPTQEPTADPVKPVAGPIVGHWAARTLWGDAELGIGYDVTLPLVFTLHLDADGTVTLGLDEEACAQGFAQMESDLVDILIAEELAELGYGEDSEIIDLEMVMIREMIEQEVEDMALTESVMPELVAAMDFSAQYTYEDNLLYIGVATPIDCQVEGNKMIWTGDSTMMELFTEDTVIFERIG